MKIRNGFVSNSSSSSFIIERSKLDEDLLNKLNECIKTLDVKIHVSKDCIRFSRFISCLDVFRKHFPPEENIFYRYIQENHFFRFRFPPEVIIKEKGLDIKEVIELGDKKLKERYKGLE